MGFIISEIYHETKFYEVLIGTFNFNVFSMTICLTIHHQEVSWSPAHYKLTLTKTTLLQLELTPSVETVGLFYVFLKSLGSFIVGHDRLFLYGDTSAKNTSYVWNRCNGRTILRKVFYYRKIHQGEIWSKLSRN